MIVPVTHKIILRPDALDEANEDRKRALAAGLVLPEADKRANASVDRGTVVAIGPVAFRDFGCENPLKEGDKISYARHSGKWITDLDGVEYVVVNDEDVCGIFKE